MKSGKRQHSRPFQMSPTGLAVLKHVARHGMTVSNVWDCPSEFAGADRTSVSKSVRELTHAGFLMRGDLHHGRFYFVLTETACEALSVSASKAGLMNEATKVRAYTKLLLLCNHRPELKSVATESFSKHFGENLRGIANRFFARPDDRQFIAFMRVDTRVQSRPSRAGQLIRTDIYRFAKHPLLASVMKQQSFEYIWITVSQPRADAVLAHFRRYLRIGKSPITIVVLPQLIPLLVGVPIDKEILALRTKT